MAFIPVAILAAVIIAIAARIVIGRRSGYNFGGKVVARCRAGHLFTTLWVPGASFKAVRLGPVRFQRCPVGNHWTLIRPVRDRDLTDDERALANQYSDGPLP